MDKQQSTRDKGALGESAVVEHLERNGYTVKDRNVACRQGEVDIIAEKQGVLCFVEVRSRATDVWGDPSGTVTYAKQRKVVLAAMRYLHQHAQSQAMMIRFDVASVVGRGRAVHVEYLENAFDAGS
jgi:putative endonuclease